MGASLLVRANLSPAEEVAHCAARKPLHEKLHPETKHGGAPGKAGGGKIALGLNLEISGFENELVDVNGIEVLQITTLFHPLFKCFSRQEPTMR
jgi:hypothetical protein